MITHHETRVLPYSAKQMYDLVADIGRYPEFLPWLAATRVRERHHEADATVEIADMMVSFKVFREKFGTRVTMRETPERSTIVSELIDGPFKILLSEWAFRDVEGGCEVDYRVRFEFKNRILQKAAGMFFAEAQKQILTAFEKRAGELHGKA